MKRRRLLIVVFCLLVLALVIVRLHCQPSLYKVTILPSLGGDYTTAYAINNHGLVAGVSRLANGTDHLFLWDRQNGMQDLGPVVDDLVEINDAGQIVGTMRDPNDSNRAFLWDPKRGRCILPTLGGDDAKPCVINGLGQVVGAAETALGQRHVFVWDAANGIRDLTPSSTTPVRAFSINDSGQVIVFTSSSSLLVETKEGEVCSSQTLPLRPACYINNAGDVVGLSRRVKGKVDVVVWNSDTGTKTVAQLKGTFPGAPKINDVGQVFFWQARRARFTVFGRKLLSIPASNYLWDPQRGAIALDGYVAMGRGEDLSITDLNDHGCLVGAVQSRNGSRGRAVLLERIAERWGK